MCKLSNFYAFFVASSCMKNSSQLNENFIVPIHCWWFFIATPVPNTPRCSSYFRSIDHLTLTRWRRPEFSLLLWDVMRYCYCCCGWCELLLASIASCPCRRQLSGLSNSHRIPSASSFSPQAAKIQYFKQLEQQLIIRNGANGCGLETYLEEDASPGDGESVAITRCLLLKRQRNHFDLVALSDMPVDKYAGDNWIIEEYFVDHNDDYLVSRPHSESQIVGEYLSFSRDALSVLQFYRNTTFFQNIVEKNMYSSNCNPNKFPSLF